MGPRSYAHKIELGFDKYVDTGCGLAPSCLSCPFPDCRYDASRTKKVVSRRDEQARETREREDRALALRRGGMSVTAIGLQLGKSPATITNYIRRAEDRAWEVG